MNIFKSKINYHIPLVLQENLIFPSPPFKYTRPLISILMCQSDIELLKKGNHISFYIRAKVEVLLECSYTLEHFSHILELDEEVLIRDTYNVNEAAMIIEEDYLNIEEIVYSLIRVNIDMRPIKPGAKLPKGGRNYRFLDEDSFKKEQEEQGQSPFENLDLLINKKK